MNKKLIICASISIFLLTGCVGRRVNYDDKPVKKIENNLQNNLEKPIEKYGSIIYQGYKSFILKVNPKLDHDIAINIANVIKFYAGEYSLDPKLVLALMSRESSFRANAVSSSGAIGLGQLLSSTAKDMGVTDPYNPEENIKATSKYLALLIKKWNGNVTLALASYKIGHGNVTKILKAGKDLPQSTRKYINDIMLAQSKISDNI